MKSSNAKTQYKLSAADLQLILALARGGKLAEAAERLGQNSSTVFRALQKIERGLGAPLFERSRTGYLANELAQSLAEQGEKLETVLETARSSIQAEPGQVAGNVRITTTDTVLHGLIAPALKDLRGMHPLLGFELYIGNELANLSRRDADIAVRATRKPPPHLVGKCLGPIRVALFGAARGGPRWNEVMAGKCAWIAPDDAMPEHPSVLWRRKHFPAITPVFKVNSILTVAELVELNLGVGILPLFLARHRPGLRQLSEELDDGSTELWLLTHAESRHLRRISAVYSYLSDAIALA
ncbi:LysR family transcriptional regulator [Pseudoduganella violaceinigra]|uniref:LysR family transcriptional regulator n=1 Tax=Pseudoduganella violaceinigra TaxID=246602 RepID=UPI000401B287|nr:LysR family transcriptional regulator [Pseudoduganella violaceinigra]